MTSYPSGSYALPFLISNSIAVTQDPRITSSAQESASLRILASKLCFIQPLVQWSPYSLIKVELDIVFRLCVAVGEVGLDVFGEQLYLLHGEPRLNLTTIPEAKPVTVAVAVLDGRTYYFFASKNIMPCPLPDPASD